MNPVAYNTYYYDFPKSPYLPGLASIKILPAAAKKPHFFAPESADPGRSARSFHSSGELCSSLESNGGIENRFEDGVAGAVSQGKWEADNFNTDKAKNSNLVTLRGESHSAEFTLKNSTVCASGEFSRRGTDHGNVTSLGREGSAVRLSVSSALSPNAGFSLGPTVGLRSSGKGVESMAALSVEPREVHQSRDSRSSKSSISSRRIARSQHGGLRERELHPRDTCSNERLSEALLIANGARASHMSSQPQEVRPTRASLSSAVQTRDLCAEATELSHTESQHVREAELGADEPALPDVSLPRSASCVDERTRFDRAQEQSSRVRDTGSALKQSSQLKSLHSPDGEACLGRAGSSAGKSGIAAHTSRSPFNDGKASEQLESKALTGTSSPPSPPPSPELRQFTQRATQKSIPTVASGALPTRSSAPKASSAIPSGLLRSSTLLRDSPLASDASHGASAAPRNHLSASESISELDHNRQVLSQGVADPRTASVASDKMSSSRSCMIRGDNFCTKEKTPSGGNQSIDRRSRAEMSEQPASLDPFQRIYDMLGKSDPNTGRSRRASEGLPAACFLPENPRPRSMPAAVYEQGFDQLSGSSPTEKQFFNDTSSSANTFLQVYALPNSAAAHSAVCRESTTERNDETQRLIERLSSHLEAPEKETCDAFTRSQRKDSDIEAAVDSRCTVWPPEEAVSRAFSLYDAHAACKTASLLERENSFLGGPISSSLAPIERSRRAKSDLNNRSICSVAAGEQIELDLAHPRPSITPRSDMTTPRASSSSVVPLQFDLTRDDSCDNSPAATPRFATDLAYFGNCSAPLYYPRDEAVQGERPNTFAYGEMGERAVVRNFRFSQWQAYGVSEKLSRKISHSVSGNSPMSASLGEEDALHNSIPIFGAQSEKVTPESSETNASTHSNPRLASLNPESPSYHNLSQNGSIGNAQESSALLSAGASLGIEIESHGFRAETDNLQSTQSTEEEGMVIKRAHIANTSSSPEFQAFKYTSETHHSTESARLYSTQRTASSQEENLEAKELFEQDAGPQLPEKPPQRSEYTPSDTAACLRECTVSKASLYNSDAQQGSVSELSNGKTSICKSDTKRTNGLESLLRKAIPDEDSNSIDELISAGTPDLLNAATIRDGYLQILWWILGLTCTVIVVVGPIVVKPFMAYWRWVELVSCYALSLTVWTTIGDIGGFFTLLIARRKAFAPPKITPFLSALNPGCTMVLAGTVTLLLLDYNFIPKYKLHFSRAEVQLCFYLRPLLILHILLAAQYLIAKTVGGLLCIIAAKRRFHRSRRIAFNIATLGRLGHPIYCGGLASCTVYPPPLYCLGHLPLPRILKRRWDTSGSAPASEYERENTLKLAVTRRLKFSSFPTAKIWKDFASQSSTILCTTDSRDQCASPLAHSRRPCGPPCSLQCLRRHSEDPHNDSAIREPKNDSWVNLAQSGVQSARAKPNKVEYEEGSRVLGSRIDTHETATRDATFELAHNRHDSEGAQFANRGRWYGRVVEFLRSVFEPGKGMEVGPSQKTNPSRDTEASIQSDMYDVRKCHLKSGEGSSALSQSIIANLGCVCVKRAASLLQKFGHMWEFYELYHFVAHTDLQLVRSSRFLESAQEDSGVVANGPKRRAKPSSYLGLYTGALDCRESLVASCENLVEMLLQAPIVTENCDSRFPMMNGGGQAPLSPALGFIRSPYKNALVSEFAASSRDTASPPFFGRSEEYAELRPAGMKPRFEFTPRHSQQLLSADPYASLGLVGAECVPSEHARAPQYFSPEQANTLKPEGAIPGAGDLLDSDTWQLDDQSLCSVEIIDPTHSGEACNTRTPTYGYGSQPSKPLNIPSGIPVFQISTPIAAIKNNLQRTPANSALDYAFPPLHRPVVSEQGNHQHVLCSPSHRPTVKSSSEAPGKVETASSTSIYEPENPKPAGFLNLRLFQQYVGSEVAKKLTRSILALTDSGTEIDRNSFLKFVATTELQQKKMRGNFLLVSRVTKKASLIISNFLTLLSVLACVTLMGIPWYITLPIGIILASVGAGIFGKTIRCWIATIRLVIFEDPFDVADQVRVGRLSPLTVGSINMKETTLVTTGLVNKKVENRVLPLQRIINESRTMRSTAFIHVHIPSVSSETKRRYHDELERTTTEYCMSHKSSWHTNSLPMVVIHKSQAKIKIDYKFHDSLQNQKIATENLRKHVQAHIDALPDATL